MIKSREIVGLSSESEFGNQFLIYAEKRVLDDMTDEFLQAEFITKCQWIQHHARTKLGATGITLETAAHAVNSTKAQSFSREVSKNIFDGFMHFVAANETNQLLLSLPANIVGALMLRSFATSLLFS